jgi:hypothetical protein
MDDVSVLADFLPWLALPAAAIWLLALRSVWRDLRRRTLTGPRLARCGLPRQAVRDAPLSRWLARHRRSRGMRHALAAR